jgi:hypothetical protein
MYAFAGGALFWALPWIRMHRSLCAGSPAACAPPRVPARQQQAAPAGTGLWPLMRRREVWAIAVTQYCSAFGFFSSLAFLPAFFLDHCGVQLSQVRAPGRWGGARGLGRRGAAAAAASAGAAPAPLGP